MDDILGGHSAPERFEEFLVNWRAKLAQRVEEAVASFSTIPGLRGLVLAGSIGRGAEWPLSDIDFLAIFEDDQLAEGKSALETRSLALRPQWRAEGWWTGVDTGKLSFGVAEVRRALEGEGVPVAELLADDRWYHSLDKGFRGRAVIDRDAHAGELAIWFTDRRFNPEVVAFRLTREQREVELSLRQAAICLGEGDLRGATINLRRAGQWLQILALEHWGERDASMARVGTQFENSAVARGRHDLIALVNKLNGLEDSAVESRMHAAPDWVWEWHDRAWRARQLVGDAVTAPQHARDVLRVCSMYELRYVTTGPFPAWLAIETDSREMRHRIEAAEQHYADVWLGEA
jgi:hypothetical protein